VLVRFVKKVEIADGPFLRGGRGRPFESFHSMLNTGMSRENREEEKADDGEVGDRWSWGEIYGTNRRLHGALNLNSNCTAGDP